MFSTQNESQLKYEAELCQSQMNYYTNLLCEGNIEQTDFDFYMERIVDWKENLDDVHAELVKRFNYVIPAVSEFGVEL